MPLNSRDKGAGGERELAALLREWGYPEARRGVQFKGGPESPDVPGVPGIHFEVKRTESFRLYAAVAQAVRDADGKAIPVVAHRRNRDGWLFVIGAEGFRTMAGLYSPPPRIIRLEDVL